MARSSGTRPYVGQFVAWDGGCLFIGRNGGVVPMHAHYAVQIAFGSEPGIRFRATEREGWTVYAGAIIPSRQPHSMDATGVAENVVLFVEPETREGRALTERWLHDGIAAIPAELLGEAGGVLFDAWRNGQGAAAIEQRAWQVIDLLSGGLQPSLAVDERILRAMAHIKANLHRSLTLETVADVACLSPSRFRHLFVEQTGMALRPYILWRRFLRVWELLMTGASLSSAAHEAGFADAAHLTRTSRTMFGLAPSSLQMAGSPTRSQPSAEAQPLRSRA